jgi:hypothetical protein
MKVYKTTTILHSTPVKLDQKTKIQALLRFVYLLTFHLLEVL